MTKVFFGEWRILWRQTTHDFLLVFLVLHLSLQKGLLGLEIR